MENQIELASEEIVQISSTKPHSIALYPIPGKTSKRTLYCFEYKNFDIPPPLKTAPASSEILCVTVPGSKGDIYYTAGNSIFGISVKGKEVFRFDANVSEKLKGLEISAGEIWISGDYIVNSLTYVSGKKPVEKDYYLSNDKINHMVVGHVSGDLVNNPILGCQDKNIHVLQGDSILYSVPLSSPATVLAFYKDNLYFYGCSDGSIGLVQLGRENGVNKWSASTTSKSSVSALKKGEPDLIVGRDDGTIEILKVSTPDRPFTETLAKSTTNESITGLDVGPIRDPAVPEIIATTFSGKIFLFWDTRTLDLNDPKLREAKENKTKLLKGEVTKLKEKLAQAKLSKSHETGAIKLGSENVQPANARMSILPSDAAYVLTELVAIHSDVPADLLDVENTKAILSVSQGTNSNQLLATLRPEEATNRLDVKIRTTEGQAGELECLVFQKSSAICQSFYLPIKPLSLHERISEYKPDPEAPAMSQITVKGNFSETEMNAWLSLCLPDVPQHFAEENSCLYYRSAFTGSHLICKYGKGTAVITSDSITTLTIIKDSIIKSAAQRKVILDTSSAMNDECTYSLLKMLHPKIQGLYDLKLKADLVEAVKELKLQQEQEASTGEKSFELPEEYEKIATNASEISKEQKKQPKKLEYIYGIIVDLYMDRANAFGLQKAETKIPALEHILHNYDFQQLTNFFKSTSK